MHRRALLATLGTGVSLLAGCQTQQQSKATTAPPPDPAKCKSPEERRIELIDTADVPESADLSITATMERQQVTSESPAQIRISLTNKGAKRATTVTETEHCHLFNRTYGGSDPAGLWLYRQQNAPDNRVGKCWTRDAGKTRTFVSIGCGKQTFASGESITTTYEIWDDYVTEGYFPTGTYRFSRSIPIWSTENTEGDPDRKIDWWMDLKVSQPNG